MTNIQQVLFALQDIEYRDFQSNLIPNVDKEFFIGIRTPVLRKYTKDLVKDASKADDLNQFLNTLPHTYFDENQLHAFILSEMKDFNTCVTYVDAFLPYIDNWATCDQMSPKVFRKHRKELQEEIRKWIRSDRTYTIRFGTGMLMEHFLDGDFRPEYLELAASVRSEEYYVNMMTAWFFATALAKQYEAALPFLEEQRLDVWTHNMTIRKAAESFRVAPEHKVYLKTLKRN